MILSNHTRRLVCLLVLTGTAVFLDCGGGGSSSGGSGGGGGGNQEGFSFSVTPSQISVPQGGRSSLVTITPSLTHTFLGSISLNAQALPAGVSTIPSLPLTLTPGTPQTLAFTATQSAITGNTPVELVATGGGQSLTQDIALQVTQPVVSPLPTLRTAFGNLNAAPLAFGDSQAVAKLIVYDSVHQQVLASNTTLNEVDVFSTVTHQQTATIPVPAPFGLDISADGSTIYVGTFTDFIYTIDPQQLVVTGQVSFAEPLSSTQSAVVNSPSAVATLSNGNVMVLLGAGDGTGAGGSLVIWDPVTDQIVETIPTQYPAIGPMARSGDHTKVAFTYQLEGGGGTTVTLYDVATDKTTNGVYLGGGIPFAIALNGNGSEIAVSGGPALQTYNNQLNPLNQTPVFSPMGVLFSTDGTKIYQSNAGSVDQVFDSATLSLVGQFSDIGLESTSGSLLGDVDSTGMVYGLSDHGVAFLDASQPTTNSSSSGLNLGYATPQAGLIGATTPLSMQVGGVDQPAAVALGGQPASDVTATPFEQGEILYANTPESSNPGPENLFVQWQSGYSWLQAEDFSNGPWARYIFETGGPPQGGAPVGIAGYGYGWSMGSPQILYGGTAATLNSMYAVSNYIEPYPYQQLQITLMTSPPGVPGLADLTINGPVGTITVPQAFHYMNLESVVTVNPNNLLKAAWDEPRNQIYLTNGNLVEVFSTTTQQLLAPITIPNATPATQLAGLAITPDDSKLLVADYGDSEVLIIDLTNTASVQSASTVLPGNQQNGSTTNPVAIAATSTGKAFVTVPNESITSPGPNSLLELDLSTLQLTTRSDAPQVDSNATIGTAMGGGELLINEDGSAQIYNAASNTFGGIKQLALGGNVDGAISSDGNAVVITDSLADGQLDETGYVAYIDLFALDAIQQFGEKWHASGSLLYVPIDHGFDIIDGNTGNLRERISVPAEIATAAPAGPMGSVDTLQVNSTGQEVLLTSTTGVVFVQLDEVPLGIGSLTPSFGAAGTAITLRGSGFTAATAVAFNGTPASATYVDTDTLQVIAPTGSGPAMVFVANANGEGYMLDAAFNYGSAPAKRVARGVLRSNKLEKRPIPPGRYERPFTVHRSFYGPS